MKKIECIILPFKLAEVKKALRRVGVRNIKANRGFERIRRHAELYNGSGYRFEFDSKLKIEITVGEENVDTVVDAIKQAVTAGNTV